MGKSALFFDASPLILLARINRLDLLDALGADINVPRTVFGEIEAGEAIDGAAARIRSAAWIQIVPDGTDDPRVTAWHIDSGETKVLSLALTVPGSVAVLDDLAARRCAKGLSVGLIGTAGVVLLCKARGVVPAAAPLLAALRQEGMYLAARTEQELLALVGENVAG